jgi:hypothetical protein
MGKILMQQIAEILSLIKLLASLDKGDNGGCLRRLNLSLLPTYKTLEGLSSSDLSGQMSLKIGLSPNTSRSSAKET